VSVPSTTAGHGLDTSLAGLHLASPLLTAAGCGGPELAPFTDLTRLGALVTRTVTSDPKAGAPSPRLAETPSGLLSAVGEQNPGLQGFLATELPWYAQRGIRTIVSISADSLAEHGELARRIGAAPGVAALEVRLGTPDGYQTGKVVHVVSRDAPRGVPVLAKLPPAGDPAEHARAAMDNGADAVVVGAGFPGLVVDPHTLRPLLGAGVGLLSGPAVHPLALRAVYDVHAAAADVPVVGVGGIRTGFDVLAMLAAGATAVQLGSVLYSDPGAPDRIVAELAEELERRDLESVADAVGLAHERP